MVTEYFGSRPRSNITELTECYLSPGPKVNVKGGFLYESFFFFLIFVSGKAIDILSIQYAKKRKYQVDTQPYVPIFLGLS